MSQIVFINGEKFNPDHAKISVFDRGFLFGDAVYEVTRSYGKIFFQIESHIDRLFNSAQQIYLNLGYSKNELINRLYSFYQQLDTEDIYMRIQVSRGQGPIGMSTDLVEKPNEVVYFYPFKKYDEKNYAEGIHVFVTGRNRNKKTALDPNIKSGNYLNNVLAFREGQKIKADETIMVDEKGFITEGCTSNVFFIKENKLYTNTDKSDILRGITRKIVLDIAAKHNIPFALTDFKFAELKDADEAFITSSTREIMPIRNINGDQVFAGPGPLTRKLAQLYKDFVKEYCNKALQTHPWRANG